MLASDTLQRRLEAEGVASDHVREQVAALMAEGREELLDDWLSVPLQDFPAFRKDGNLAPYFDEWVARPSYDDYWATLDLETKYPPHPGPRAGDGRLVRRLP